jgi:hypothetical protein
MAKIQKLSRWQAVLRGALLFGFLFSQCFAWAGGASPAAAEVVTTFTGGCRPGSHCIYLPSVRSGVGAGGTADLVVNGIELTQAVQDDANSVPLVAGRATMLRVFATTTGSTTAVGNVKVSVMAARGWQMLSGAPRVVQATVPLNYSRSQYSSSINIQLPAAWLTGTVDLTVTLDPDNAIGEANKGNNTLTRRVTFNAVPPLNVMIVPVQYTHVVDGSSTMYPAPTQDTVLASCSTRSRR